eukprot:2133932-Ditylum_brightwellii.AAC.1
MTMQLPLKFCLSKEETWEHLFQCRHDDAIAIKVLALTQLKSNLIQSKTSPAIRNVILYKMVQWLHVPLNQAILTVHSDHLGDNLRLALEQQAAIGWNNFAKGQISKEWGAMQQIFYDQFYPTSSYNAELWM